MDSRFSGKVAIVTGSGRGIGRATVLGMAKEGARLCVTSRTLEDVLEVAEEAREFGGEAIAVTCDVGDTAQVQNMIDKTLAAFGRIDILVNNAAGGESGAAGHLQNILECTQADWDAQINGSLTSVYRVSHLAVPHIIKAGGGAIVNISSTRGLSGRANRVAYGAAKAGVINLTRCMALDLLQYKVRVNCICPGHVESEHMKAAAEIVRDPSRRDAVLASFRAPARLKIQGRVERLQGHPEELAGVLGRGFTGYPDQLASAIMFLASEESSFINGEILTVDGGSSAGK